MDSCAFCQIIEGKVPAHIIFANELVVAFLDNHPQTRGHIQLVPRIHYRWIYQMPEMGAVFSIAGRIIRVIIPLLGADHVTIATFGHHIAHAHTWIVPQYGRTEVVSEHWGRNDSEQARLAARLKKALLKEVSI